MAEHSTIEWTDATWNPVTGCSVVSPGCTNCYAMKLAGTRLRNHPSRAGLTVETKAGPVWNGEVRLNEQWLDEPLRWKRPRTIFVCAHGDLFHESVPDAWIDRVFAVMTLATQHTFQVLTKRSERMRAYVGNLPNRDDLVADVARQIAGDVVDRRKTMVALRNPLPNVWLGVSAERQQEADERIPDLLATPAAVRFLSAEPLLGPIDLARIRYTRDRVGYRIDALNVEGVRVASGWVDHGEVVDQPNRYLDWVIVGGESGQGARPMHPAWARQLRDQCAAAGVPFFFKQWGEWVSAYDRDRDDPDWRRVPKPGDWDRKRWLNLAGGQGFHGDQLNMMRRVGKKASGRLLDGVEHNALPALKFNREENHVAQAQD